MKKRVCALAAAVLLTLSACGGGRSDESVLGRASGIPEEQTLLTADGAEIPAWRYLYWLALACDRTANEYRSVGGTVDWTAGVDGGTLAEYVKAQALSDTLVYAAVEALAARYGCTLDAADEAAVAAQWESRCAAHGGEDAYLAVIAPYGLDRNRAEDLFRTGRLYGKLWVLCQAGGAFGPDAETLSALERESGQVRFDRILSGGGDRDYARGRAEHLFSRLNAAEDQGALFAELAAASDDPAGPRTLSAGTLDETLSGVVRSLAVGQLSGIVENGEGYSILRRLPPDREALLGDWLDRTLEETAANMAVLETDRFADLNAGAFAAALEAARRAEEPPE